MLTSEQAIALAPDASSAKAGKELAIPRKWVTLGSDGIAVWGQCQGSGKNPYQTQIVLGENTFKCSCPSRKFPCKHGLGLLLLLAEQSTLFTEKQPPPWVAEWLQGRNQRAEKNKERAIETNPKAADVASQEKRAQSREKKVRAGLQELETWLHDLIRAGIATAQSQPYSYWDSIAARMVDAQAPGVARLIREMAGASAQVFEVNSIASRESEMLWHLARLHLLLQGFARLEELSPEMQVEVRAQIGWTYNQDELLAQPGVRDCWKVLSSRVQNEEKLRVSRTWLWGCQSERFALVLQFAHGSTPMASTFLPGTEIEAELCFFPGAYPLRAMMKDFSGASQTFSAPPARATIAEAFDAYAQALAQNPWLTSFPISLKNVLPIIHNDGALWKLQDASSECSEDADKHEIRLSPTFENNWKLMAISGGAPLFIFGEWNGHTFLPLAAMADSRWSRL